MLKAATSVGAKTALCIRTPPGAFRQLPTVRAYIITTRSASGMNPVHGHSGTTVPPDADMKAAKEGQAQFCGSGEPLDLNKNNDIAHRHSGTSVPHDADMKAAREGQAQFLGSGQPLDINTVATEDEAAAADRQT